MLPTGSVKKAREYAKQYGFPLLRKWDGGKAFWHVWHQPHPIYWLGYEEYILRIIEIAERKPEMQRQGRFDLLRPVKRVFSKDAARTKADAAWTKAAAAWTKADAAWTKAAAAWTKAAAARTKADAAWTKAAAAWRDKNYSATIEAHNAECPGCKWNGHTLPQFD